MFDCIFTSRHIEERFERNIIATVGVTKTLSWSKPNPIWITVNMVLKSADQLSININDVEIVYANSASVFRPSWNECVRKMIANNITPPNYGQQFCYC